MKDFLLSLCFVLFASVHVSGQTQGLAPDRMAPDRSSQNTASSIRQDMRKLWSDHVVWTRDYIIAVIAGQPDQKAAADRLMKNQEDIGGAIAAYYGKATGDKLTGLLKEHVQIAVDVISAAKANQKAKLQTSNTRWKKNAEDIATFLSQANPNWPKATLVSLMNTHLSTTTNEVTARLNKDWAGDVKAFDGVYAHILKMSDALSDGIIKQFPEKFSDAGKASTTKNSGSKNGY